MSNYAKVSLPIIRRLPRYYRCLAQLQAQGVIFVSSAELANLLGITASQVRQDFNSFGHAGGRQGVGYKVGALLTFLEEQLFGDGALIPAIQIGAGRLGKAVSRFISRETNGYDLLAVFDTDPSVVGTTIGDANVTVLHIDRLKAFCKATNPRVAVLCVPREVARQITEQLVELGIQGFWNFSHYDMSVDYPETVVENVHLGDSLMSLGYRMREKDAPSKRDILKENAIGASKWDAEMAMARMALLPEGHSYCTVCTNTCSFERVQIPAV